MATKLTERNKRPAPLRQTGEDAWLLARQQWDAAPEDDEPVSEADLRAVDEALADHAAGRCVPHE